MIGETSMETLIVQSYCWCPCLETAGEIALQLRDEGKKVGFYFIDVNDPFEPVPWGIWPIHAKKKRKVRQLEHHLHKVGVICIRQDEGELKSETLKYVESINIETNQDLKNFRYDGMDLGMGVLSHMITILADPYPDMWQNKRLVKGGLISSIWAYELTVMAINRYKPKEIIVFNGRFAVSNAIACAAKKENIKLLYFEDSATFRRFNVFEKMLFDPAYLKQLIDGLWGNGEEEKIAVAKDFFVRQREGRREQRSYIKNQLAGYIPAKMGRRITFFTTSDDELLCIPLNDSLGQSNIFNSQRHAIATLLDWVAEKSGVELAIRVHPHVSKKSKKEREFWNNITGGNVALIDSYSRVDSYALMESSDIVLTYSSTVGIEATFWGRPSISLARAEYYGFGCVYEPISLHELFQLLETDLEPLPRESCLPYGYYAAMNGNHACRYYNPISPSDGTFCGQKLSMDLPIVHAFKKSFVGKTLKSWRDKLFIRR